jgi:type II secretory pathway pseudopilin PulG
MIVIAILGLLLAMTVPYYVRQRATAQANSCVNNLIKLDNAANQFAIENSKKTGATINYPQDLTPYIKLNSASQIPTCPASGTYLVAVVGSSPTCSLGNTVTPQHVVP